jgi:hypothetical protein
MTERRPDMIDIMVHESPLPDETKKDETKSEVTSVTTKRLAPVTTSVTEVVQGQPLRPIQREQEESNIFKEETDIPKPKVDEKGTDEDPDNNYRSTICKKCVIYDTVGCDHCALYVYGYKHQEFKFKVTKL